MSEVMNATRAELLTEDDVTAYLKANPDFLAQNPDVVEQLDVPRRWRDAHDKPQDRGAQIIDMQHFMADKLRGEIDDLRECTSHLISTSRDNLSLQSRAHAGVIALLTATNLTDGAHIVRYDLPFMLGVHAASIGFEPGHPTRPSLMDDNVRTLPKGAVDHMLGEGKEIKLIETMADDGTVFGRDGSNVRSCVLIRLHLGGDMPDGLLAFGANEEGFFHPGLGTDLIAFVARVLERCLNRWLIQIP